MTSAEVPTGDEPGTGAPSEPGASGQNETIMFEFSGIDITPGTAEASCPLEWQIFNACVESECPNSKEVCPNAYGFLPSNVNPDGDVNVLKQNFLRQGDQAAELNVNCEGLNDDICDALTGNGGTECCLSSCATELHVLAICRFTDLSGGEALNCSAADVKNLQCTGGSATAAANATSAAGDDATTPATPAGSSNQTSAPASNETGSQTEAPDSASPSWMAAKHWMFASSLLAAVFLL